MRILFYFALIGFILDGTSVTFGQATHNISDGFNFGGGEVNPNNGWTYADAGANALTNFVQDWNAPDFAPGQPGWEGPPGAAHAGWAQMTENNALASGYDVVAGEIVTHGTSNVIYTPNATLGDPFTGHHSVSISGSLHNLRPFNRSGAWALFRNNTDLLATGVVDDTTLSFNNGPLDLAEDATFVNASQVTVSGSQLAGISYNPGDFFNLTIGNNDFVAVDLTVQSFTAPGNGFGGTNVNLPQVAYYRFEEASGVDVNDSLSGAKHGAFVGAPAGMERSNDVPAALIPQTGAANLRAADFRQGGSVLFNASEFVFNEANAGGADGDATLEWFMKVPNDASPDILAPNGHTSIFWTNGIGGFDGERYNIFWDANFTGTPDSDRFISGDFRSIAGGGGTNDIAGGGHNNGVPLTEDAWHHIAIVRTDNTPANADDFDFTWDWYIDGALSPSHNAVTTAPTPSQDAFGWTVAGRPGLPFHALIDEVRLTAAALAPSQFLNAPAGPSKPGDFDGDGDADGNDFLVWQRGGSPNPLSSADLALWKTNFGTASSVSALTPTPEPSCAVIVTIAGFAITRWSRGRSGQV